MIKRLFTLLCSLMLVALTACHSDIEQTTPGIGTTQNALVSVTAYTPTQSRVDFTENSAAGTISLNWEQQESFSVIRGTENQTFSKNSEGNTFTGILPDAQGEGTYYAIYPTTEACDAEAVPFDLTTQTGELDSEMTYMRAESTAQGKSFNFHHCTAILKVSFSGLPSDAKVKSVELTTSPEVKVNGNINLEDGSLSGGTSNTITIDFATAEALSSLYIYMPPMAAADKTLSFEVTTAEGDTYTHYMEASGSKNIEAGNIYYANIDVAPTDDSPYITFTAAAEQTFTMSMVIEGMEYSLNDGEWTILEGQTITFGGELGKLRLRSKNAYGTTLDHYSLDHNTIKFGNNTAVACTGDIRTLVDWENYTTVDTSNARFCYLFNGCTQLTSAPRLPSTSLATRCYKAMFSGCTALQSAPVLPATTLANECYYDMFRDCASLSAAPKLPATTLASDCYYAMFLGCSSLLSAPKLPATELALNCYYFMFCGCTGIDTAPELPASTLKVNCYYGMFENCTALKAAPELIASVLVDRCYYTMFKGCTALQETPLLAAAELAPECYYEMFSGCSNLSSVTMLATDISARDCLTNWLADVALSGTFTKHQDMRSLINGDSGVPNGWSVSDYIAEN